MSTTGTTSTSTDAADCAVDLVRRMREAGAISFEFDGKRLKAELRPPEPPPLTALAAQIGELPVRDREELLASTQRELEADLYGSSQ